MLSGYFAPDLVGLAGATGRCQVSAPIKSASIEQVSECAALPWEHVAWKKDRAGRAVRHFTSAEFATKPSWGAINATLGPRQGERGRCFRQLPQPSTGSA